MWYWWYYGVSGGDGWDISGDGDIEVVVIVTAVVSVVI
jgi:hypothetical protein